MGCWNETCMITQLPITSGQKVALFILKKMRNRYVVSSFAIKGEYNDYGQLEEDSIELDDEHIKILKQQDDFSEFNSVYEIINAIEREEINDYGLGFINLSVFNEMVKHIERTSSYKSDIINNEIIDLLGKEIMLLCVDSGIVYFENTPKNSIFLDESHSSQSVLYELRKSIFIELFENKNKEIIPFISELILFNCAMNRGRKIYTSFEEYSGSQAEYYGIHSIINETVKKEIEDRWNDVEISIEKYDCDKEDFDYMFKK